MRVAAVIVTHNDSNKLELFKRHFDEYKEHIDLIIIVDNGSALSFKEQLKRPFSQYVIIERSTNGGTTGAYNDGIRYALQHGVDAVLLIAQDMKMSPSSLVELVRILEKDPEVGIVGPLLLKADGQTIEEYGGKTDLNTMVVTKNYAHCPADEALPQELAVDFVAGGMNLTRREVFEQIGLQDERLFMYGDETDFDLRARKAGWKLVVTCRAIAIHEHKGGSSVLRPRPLFLLIRNRLWLVHKHMGHRALLEAGLPLVWGLPRRFIHYLKHRQYALAWAYASGVFYGILGI